jgi:hypothetical protein
MTKRLRVPSGRWSAEPILDKTRSEEGRMTLPTRSFLPVAVALVMALGAEGAGAVAGALIRPAGSISEASSGALNFRSGEITVSCNVTLSGSFNSALVRAVEETISIGSFTSGSWSGCRNGEMSAVLASGANPFGIRIIMLGEGAPPTCILTTPGRVNATALCAVLRRITGIAVGFRTFGFASNCLYGGATAIWGELALLTPSLNGTYQAGTLTFLPGSLQRNVERSEVFCPERIETSGRFAEISPTQTITFL